MKHIPVALTYDDVLIVPRRSTFKSRSEANTKTMLTKKVKLNIPIVSANMDSVTESDTAIALARLGGIGILHRFMSIEDNVAEVKRVKRAQNFIIHDPYSIEPDKTINEAKAFVNMCGVSGLIVANTDKRLLGILSGRDLFFAEDSQKVSEAMTPRDKLVVGNSGTTFEEARKLFAQHKIEKLPLVDESGIVKGLITSDDSKHLVNFPNANVDEEGRLIVGAAVGVKGDYIERAQALKDAGVDVLVIDIAHGHSELMFGAIRTIREACGDLQLIAGNIATPEAARDLCEAGVDAIKIGIGPGTTCTTRLVAGCGVPQLTAVMQCAEVAKEYGVPVIADGGIQKPGDIVKAVGAGADTVMLGGLLAGVAESPGVVMMRGNKKFKVCRGSSGFRVAQRRKSVDQEEKSLEAVVPEGVESIVPFKGPLDDLVKQLVGGLRSGMSYTNSHTIEELQRNVDFVRITSAGLHESGPHDVQDVK